MNPNESVIMSTTLPFRQGDSPERSEILGFRPFVDKQNQIPRASAVHSNLKCRNYANTGNTLNYWCMTKLQEGRRPDGMNDKCMG
jgi:hypothetical protein